MIDFTSESLRHDLSKVFCFLITTEKPPRKMYYRDVASRLTKLVQSPHLSRRFVFKLAFVPRAVCGQ